MNAKPITTYFLTESGEALPEEPSYQSHFETCPQANSWSKKGKQ